jgi:hypothetical protein
MTSTKLDIYFKDKLAPLLEKSGWYNGRHQKVQEKYLYWDYDYSANQMKIYEELVGLTIKNPDDRTAIIFTECEEAFEKLDDEEDIWTQESYVSKLLNRNLCFIGFDDDINRICIDEDNNFYSVCDYSVSLYSERSFFQGLYNFLSSVEKKDNPYYLHYKLPISFEQEFHLYNRDEKGNLLWLNESKNKFFYQKKQELIAVKL